MAEVPTTGPAAVLQQLRALWTQQPRGRKLAAAAVAVALVGAIGGLILGRFVDQGHGSRLIWPVFTILVVSILARVLAPNAAMAVHGYFAMAYDPGRNVTVLYGGENTMGGNTVVLGETWEFNGTTWTMRTPAATPGKRTKAAMAYDAGRKQMVLVGGNNGTNLLRDAWTWDGTTFKKGGSATPVPNGQYTVKV